jgi:hypothetical protein
MSLTLFNHVSHTIFEVKIPNPSHVVIDKHSIDSSDLRVSRNKGNQWMPMIHPHIENSQIYKRIPLSQDNAENMKKKFQ